MNLKSRLNVASKSLLVLLVGLLITWALFYLAGQAERRVALTKLWQDADRWVSDVDADLRRQIALFQTVRSVLSTGEFRRATFYRISEDAFSQYPGLVTLSWVPVANSRNAVPKRQRQRIEKPEFDNLVFKDWTREGLLPSSKRDEYFPIYYLFNRELNYSLHGLDINTLPGYEERLKDIRLLGGSSYALNFGPSFSQLSGFSSNENLIQLAAPIFWESIDNEERRRVSFRGYLFMETNIYSRMQQFSDSVGDAVSIDVVSSTLGRIYSKELKSLNVFSEDSYSRSISPELNSQWEFNLSPSKAYFDLHKGRLPYWLALLGVIVSIYSAIYFFRLRLRLEALELTGEYYETQIAERNQRLKSLAYLDELTGLANRKSFDESLRREWRRGARDKKALGLIVADIDNFSAYNEQYGRESADACLKKIAKCLEGCVGRGGDRVARFGGEEFALLLPDTSVGAEVVAEKCQQQIAALKIPNQGDDSFVSLSFGVASLQPDSDSEPNTLVRLADEALYKAKAEGKNTIVTADKS